MSQAQRTAFLADVHVGVIAVDDPDGDRAPIAVPIWYDFSPEHGVTVITSRRSRKGRAIEAAGRFSLVAQRESAPYMYVSVEGPVVEATPCDRERDLRPMAVRYLGERDGDAYADAWQGDADDVTYRMQPEHWNTIDYTGDM